MLRVCERGLQLNHGHGPNYGHLLSLVINGGSKTQNKLEEGILCFVCLRLPCLRTSLLSSRVEMPAVRTDVTGSTLGAPAGGAAHGCTNWSESAGADVHVFDFLMQSDNHVYFL